MTCPLPFGLSLLTWPAPADGTGDSGTGSDQDGVAERSDRGDSRAVRFVHSLAVGPAARRRRWTPAGLGLFGASLALVVFGGLATDRVLAIRTPPGNPAWTVAGLVLILGGLALSAWCAGLFARARGTPVPVNPPWELIQGGPYAWVRNPMLTGVFSAVFGTGLVLRSPSTVLLWGPAYVLLHVLELRWVEEPELERRFGVAYRAYRDTVPMFLPLPRLTAGGRLRRRPDANDGRSVPERVLSVAFLGLVAGGLLLVAAPDWIGLAWLNRGVDRAFFQGTGPTAGAMELRRWLYGVEGATLVAFGALGFAVVRTAVRGREPWAWKALVTAVGAWFLLDTSTSLAHGVRENVVLKVVIALVVLVPALALRLTRRPPAPS